MYLKSLTLKGFKSFASATTLEFEPGVTAVVGPNGSGKSNVVDALAWVMGEQGAKALRGGKMEDVIFAGTAGRPPLGRAEVSLTIDNTDGALPIDYTEVTISRIMFRSGGSEYAINGSACRLLDVQELLSDSGIGREMHVIVGQGQLDTILHATAEDRRGFVEEAAGVLKHRKRKEKALRKLDGLSEKLSRLQDLATELRRQLKPLGRQAEVARRAAVIQADVRDARLRLLADDYVTAVTALEREVADEEALLHKRGEREAALLALRAQEADLQAAAETAEPQLELAEDLWHRLTRVSERLRGLAALAAERRQSYASAATESPGRDPEHLRREAAQVQQQQAALSARIREQTDQAAAVQAARVAVESELVAVQQQAKRDREAAERARAAASRTDARRSAAAAAVEARSAELERAARPWKQRPRRWPRSTPRRSRRSPLTTGRACPPCRAPTTRRGNGDPPRPPISARCAVGCSRLSAITPVPLPVPRRWPGLLRPLTRTPEPRSWHRRYRGRWAIWPTASPWLANTNQWCSPAWARCQRVWWWPTRQPPPMGWPCCGNAEWIARNSSLPRSPRRTQCAPPIGRPLPGGRGTRWAGRRCGRASAGAFRPRGRSR